MKEGKVYLPENWYLKYHKKDYPWDFGVESFEIESCLKQNFVQVSGTVFLRKKENNIIQVLYQDIYGDFGEKYLQVVVAEITNQPIQEKVYRKLFSKRIRIDVFKRDNYKCLICGTGKEKTSLHIDHIIPISKRGTNNIENLQTLCAECNISKADRIGI